MKEHEEDVLPSAEKPTVTLDSTAIDEIVTEKLGVEVGKTEGFLAEGDEGEDMMVDVVGADAVDDDHVRTVANLDSKSGSGVLVEECMKKETATRDVVMEEVFGSGEDVCDASGETRVLTFEKVEVSVNEEGFKTSVEVSKDILQENDVTKVTSGSDGDVQKSETLVQDSELAFESANEGNIAVIDSKESTESDSLKVAESPITTANLGSDEVDMVNVEEGFSGKNEAEAILSVDPSLVSSNNQDSSTQEVNSRAGEEENLNPTVEVKTDDTQQNGTDEVNEEIVKEYETLDSVKISEPLTTINPDSEDVDVVVVDEVLSTKDEAQDGDSVDPNLVNSATGEGEVNAHDENLDQHAKVDKLTKNENFHTTIELITNDGQTPLIETGVGDRKLGVDQESGLIKNEKMVEQLSESVQDPAYKDDVIDEKTGKAKEVLDSLNIPESLTEVNLDPNEVLTTNNESQDIDSVNQTLKVNGEMNGFQESADVFEEVNIVSSQELGMDIDEVLGWKDDSDVFEEALIGDKDKNSKSQEPIVYERRAHVEVPLYDTLDEVQSPLSQDENLKVETDSDEEDDESIQEEDDDLVDQSTTIEKNESSLSLRQSRYFKPPKKEGKFSVSDLVWGKVRSHPWWPGQILNPSDASDRAMKYHKKDCFLVAYFGDRTFAWNDSGVLKPFRANFSQIEKNTNLEAFKNAVNCALEEVSRRVELGLACSCVDKDVYDNIKYQVIENTGVNRKAKKRHGKDESTLVNSFEPDKLVDYVRQLAMFPGEGDKMELTMAKAQLSSYGRYKGHRTLPEYQICGGDLLEETDNKIVENPSQKFENKERSLSDLTDDRPDSGDADVADGAHVHVTSNIVSSSGSRKRKPKPRDSISDSSVKKHKVSNTPIISTPKPSFKIGECIRRVASQLTGPPKVEQSQSQSQQVDQQLQLPEDSGNQTSVAEMLSQLHLTAQDPMKDFSFLNTIIPFFYDRRAAVFTKSLKQNPSIKPVISRKRKPSSAHESELFEFDDANDSYWTDRIIQNHSEDQLLQDNEVVEYEPEKPAKRKRRSTKKQFLIKDQESEVNEEEEMEVIEKRRQNLATEVILKFGEGIYFPSEIHLNKMFRRFGPLMESETEVDRQSGRARVVFKKCSDAEVAHSSAGKFNIFGAINVNYELNYTPLVSYKPLPLPMDAT